MNVTNLVKMASILIVWMLVFVFFVMRLNNQPLAVSISTIIIWAIVASYLFYKLFRIILNKDNSPTVVYNYAAVNPLIINLLPIRVTFFSVVMILFSCSILFEIFFPALFRKGLSNIDFNNTDTYLNILFIGLFLFILFAGLKLFIRRNNVIQFEVGNTGIKYRDINWGSGGKSSTISIVTMYFTKKFKFISYNDIKNISIIESTTKGSIINLITKDSRNILLPFLPNDSNQFDAVKKVIQNRLENHK